MTSQLATIYLFFAILAVAVAALLGRVAARMGFPVPDERRRIGCIDGLRGYLALMVMVHHFSIWIMMTTYRTGWQPAPVTFLRNFGVMSVMLFFMITGFLFYEKIKDGFHKTDWRRLYISRVFRILPLQFVVVMMISIVALVGQNFEIGYTWITWPARVLLWTSSLKFPMLFGFQESSIVNAQVFWSLRYEWIFYLIMLPILALLMSSSWLRARRVLMPVGMIAIGLVASIVHPSPLFLHSLMAFGFGIAVRQAVATKAAAWFKTWPAALVSATLLILAYAYSPSALALPTQIIIALFFMCVASGNSFGGLLSNRGALVLGEISFGIYVLHGVVLYIGFRGFGAFFAGLAPVQISYMLPLFAVIVTLASLAAFLLIEKPGIDLGRRAIRRDLALPFRKRLAPGAAAS
jgi:peptidoglycan/LPS O-acetylase OafA/YrhL